MCLGVPCSSIPWYCNVPLLAFGLSDCDAIFAQQAQNQAAGIASIGGAAAAGAVQGAGQGSCQATLGGGTLATTICQNPLVAFGIGAAILVGIFVVVSKL